MVIESGLELMQEIHHRVPDVEIRDEQIDALNAIQQNEAAGNDASLIVMPPGIGKTIVMAADSRRRLLEDPKSRTLFLCDSNDILNQTRDRFADIVGREFSYGLFSGDGHDYDELSILFGSFQVMSSWRYAFLRDEFDYGAVDESHHSKAPTYEPTLDYFDFKHLLGATATPDRYDVKDIRDIFGPECYKLTLEEAIARRLLASVDYHVITDDLVDTGRVIDDEGDEYNIKDFDRTIFAPKRDDEIIAIAKRYAEDIKDPKTIGFCKSIAQAEIYAELWEDAAALHSGLSRAEQREILESFREGVIKAVFTVDMFNEGVDIPDANQILFLRGTGSKTIYLQQLGRGLRKTKTKKRVQVLDFVNNAERLLLVDRVWRKAAALANSEPDEDAELYEISMSNVQFDEASVNTLKILRAITAKVYQAEQAVPADSKRASQLATELNMTKASLMVLAKQLNIEPSIFPTRRGNEIPYFLPDEIERIRLAYKHLFE